MPVPIPGSKVGSDSQKVKFLTISGRPKTGIFRRFRGVPGRAPLATNHSVFLGLPNPRNPWKSMMPRASRGRHGDRTVVSELFQTCDVVEAADRG
jgi:hypothetical protein